MDIHQVQSDGGGEHDGGTLSRSGRGMTYGRSRFD